MQPTRVISPSPVLPLSPSLLSGNFLLLKPQRLDPEGRKPAEDDLAGRQPSRFGDVAGSCLVDGDLAASSSLGIAGGQSSGKSTGLSGQAVEILGVTDNDVRTTLPGRMEPPITW